MRWVGCCHRPGLLPVGSEPLQTLPEGLPHRLQSPAASSWAGDGLQSRREAAMGPVGGLWEGPGAGAVLSLAF